MLLVTQHPTYALFLQAYEAGTFECDVKRLARMVTKTLEPLPKPTNINPTHHDLAALVRECFVAGEPIAVDIETAPCNPAEPWTGKQPTRALIKSIAFGNCDRAIAFWYEDLKFDTATMDMVAAVLADPCLVKVFQNGIYFDIPVLKRYGFNVVSWEDTRDLRRALVATSRLSLRYLVSIYTDFWNWKDAGDDDEKTSLDEVEDDTDEEGDVPTVPHGEAAHSWQTKNREELLTYNGLDCVGTARARRGLRRDLEAKGEDKARVVKLYNLHEDLAAMAADMHQTGMWVNQSWRNTMRTWLAQEIAERAEIVVRLADVQGFRPTAHQLRSLIFRRHAKAGLSRWNLPDPYSKKQYTKSGMCAVNEQALLLLMVTSQLPPELTALIEAWWDYQGALKRAGYVNSRLIDEATGPDGRCRAGFNSCGTDTGRPSCSEPNMLNVEKALRSMFGPPPGRMFIHADKSQLELRVMECVAADNFLGDALATGDVYAAAAKVWFDLPAELTNKQIKADYGGLRQTNKIIQLARQYGAGENTVFQQALRQNRKFTLGKVQTLVKQWDKTNYRTKAYWFEEQARVMATGYSESRICFRRRNYPQPPELTEVANYPVQSTAADLMNIEMVELWKRLRADVPDAKLLCYMYDAADVECREQDEEKVMRIMRDVMERSWTIDGRTREFPMEYKTVTSSGTWAEVA